MQRNNALLLKYFKEEGRFRPYYSDGLLELGQSAYNSLSRYLNEYNQYLLSEKVNYDELNELHINGAFGYLDSCGICVPKSFYNDNHFIHNAPKAPYIRHGYNVPTINEFDTIICSGISEDLKFVRNFTHDIFVGYCVDLKDSDKLKKYRDFYNNLIKLYNFYSNNSIMFIDIDSANSKEYCLIKNK